MSGWTSGIGSPATRPLRTSVRSSRLAKVGLRPVHVDVELAPGRLERLPERDGPRRDGRTPPGDRVPPRDDSCCLVQRCDSSRQAGPCKLPRESRPVNSRTTMAPTRNAARYARQSSWAGGLGRCSCPCAWGTGRSRGAWSRRRGPRSFVRPPRGPSPGCAGCRSGDSPRRIPRARPRPP